jgi:hypothetical protein
MKVYIVTPSTTGGDENSIRGLHTITGDPEVFLSKEDAEKRKQELVDNSQRRTASIKEATLKGLPVVERDVDVLLEEQCNLAWSVEVPNGLAEIEYHIGPEAHYLLIRFSTIDPDNISCQLFRMVAETRG